MCTLLILHGVRPDVPLVIAANRDELYQRASTAPQLLHESPAAIGGVDARGGGTWMGATARGLFAGVTNQRTYHPADARLRSRGEVVRTVLGRGTTAGAAAWLETLDAREFNSFNLLFGSAGDLRVAYARTDRRTIEIEPVPVGLHVLPNDRLGTREFPKVERALALVRPVIGAPRAELPELLRGVLADHDKPPPSEVPAPPPDSELHGDVLRELQAICIHTPFYGTRSSTYVELREDGVDRYLFADGPPCVTPWSEVTELLTRPSTAPRASPRSAG